MSLEARAVLSDEALASLAPAWERLWAECPQATPFQTPAFLLPWRRRFRPGPLASVAVFDGARLVALAPLYREEETRRLLPLGISLGDRLDVLVAPDAPDAAAALVDGLARLPGWRALALEELGEDAAARALPFPAGFARTLAPASACPAIALSPQDAATLACVPPERRRRLRRARRLAHAAGGLSIEERSADPDGFMRVLVELHGRRWRGRGERGVLADADVRAFHAEAARRLAQAGLARLFVARIGDEEAGAYYGLHAKGRAYAYLGGFDPAFERESPGAILMGHAIETAAREGASVFDLLRGREAYKYAWGASDRWNARLVVEREG